ncbi:MAG: CPBP family intramembrane metalloprotease [Lachnospiraceae bacterium]|nr:CPBP family intramembrane metalloprotease [Lachnospiraceae bacterium]
MRFNIQEKKFLSYCLGIVVFIQVFHLFDTYIPIDGLWTGFLMYLLLLWITIYCVVKVEKKPLSYIGLKKPCLWDIPKGLLLGCCMFAVQQIPLLLMKMDYSVYAMEPEWDYIIVISLYCFFCVGIVEEVVFRGFILRKSQEIWRSKVICVVVNIFLFYLVHSLHFAVGEFYNIMVNVIFLCVYYFKSKNKSLVPLIVAHGFYDVLTSVLLPVFVYWAFG